MFCYKSDSKRAAVVSKSKSKYEFAIQYQPKTYGRSSMITELETVLQAGMKIWFVFPNKLYDFSDTF